MRGISAETERDLLLSVGSHQASRPLSPVEVAQALNAAQSAGMTLQQLARALHLDGTSMISRFLRLLRLTPAIRHLVDWGRGECSIAFTAASEVARILDNDDQERLVHATLEHGLTTGEVKQAVQLLLRSSDKSMDACVDEVLRMRPQVERVHVFIGEIPSVKTHQKLSRLKQAQRDALLSTVVRRRFPDIKRFTGRLGTQRFTLAGDQQMASRLTTATSDFESTIISALEECLAED